MSGFDPGPGWRELEPDERYTGSRRDQLMWTGTRIGDTRYWVRNEPAPPLPTEPGTVIAVGDWWLVRLRPYEYGDAPDTWEMLPQPRHVSIRLHENGIKDQCVYSDDWVRTEVEQEGGYRIIASPVGDES